MMKDELKKEMRKLKTIIHTTFPNEGRVYKITNVCNNKFYIGSSVNIRDRLKDHVYSLFSQGHHSSYLQNAWNKYGYQSFQFEIIEKIAQHSEQTRKEYISVLRAREQYYLDTLTPWKREIGYNIDRYALADCRPLTEEDFHNNKSRSCTGEQFDQIIHLLSTTKMQLVEIGRVTGVSIAVIKNIYEHKLRGLNYDNYNFLIRERKWKQFADANKDLIVKLFSDKNYSIMSFRQEYGFSNNVSNIILKYLDIEPAYKKVREIYQFDFNGNFIQSFDSIAAAKREGFHLRWLVDERIIYTRSGNSCWSFYPDGRDIILSTWEKLFKRAKKQLQKAVIEFSIDGEPINYYSSFSEICDTDAFRISLQTNQKKIKDGKYWMYEDFVSEEDIEKLLEKINQGILEQK